MAQEFCTLAVADLIKKRQAKWGKDRKIMLELSNSDVTFQIPSSGEIMKSLFRSGPDWISDTIK